MKRVLLSVAFFLATIISFSQSVGDYRSAADGNWNTNTTWQMWNGTTWIAATSYPGQNPGTAEVFIQTAHDISLTATVPNSIGSLRIGTTGTDGTLTFNAGAAISLTVTGDVKVDDGSINMTNASGSKTHTFTIGGSLVVGISGGGGNDIFDMVEGNDVCDVTFNGTNISINVSDDATNTLIFNNVTFSNTGTVTISNNIDQVAGTMTVSANSIIDPAATSILGNNTGTIGGTGTIKVRLVSAMAYPTQYNFSTDNLSSLKVDYAGAGAQTISGLTYGSLMTSGSGTKTLGAAATVNDQFTIGAGTTFTPAALTLSLVGVAITVDGTLDFSDANGALTNTSGTSTLTMGSAGLIRTLDPNGLGPAANASLINSAGTFTTTGVADNGTVEYYRSATSGQTVTDRDYHHLIINGNTQIKTWTLAAARTVNGDLTISANAPFTLSGGQTLNIKGTWAKNSTGTFTPGTTVVRFNGTSAQSIGGSQTTNFNSLSIDNAAGVTLGNGVFISTNLNLQNGVITSSNTNLLTINDNATVTGFSDNSFVDGPVKKIGNDAFTFPVGKTAFGGHSIAITAPLNVTDEFTATYHRAPYSLVGPIDQVSGLCGVSNCEYWQLTRDAGTSNVNVTISWTPMSPCSGNYVTTTSGLTVAWLNGSSQWTLAPGTGTNISGSSTAGTVERVAVSSYGYFALGNLNPEGSPLPVKLSSLKASEVSGGIKLLWTNQSESDVVSYTIERSFNGSNFTNIHQLAAAKNSGEAVDYRMTDPTPLQGNNFYRIKVVEANGKVTYSSVARINLTRGATSLNIYPNPVKGGQLGLQIDNLPKGDYWIRVYNTNAQAVTQQKMSHNGGSISETIDINNLKPGIYTIELNGTARIQKQFVVQ